MTASRQASWLLSRQNGPGDGAIAWDIAPVLWSNHTDTLLRVALDGAGIAALPVELAAPHLFSQSLVRVLPTGSAGASRCLRPCPAAATFPAHPGVSGLPHHRDPAEHGACAECSPAGLRAAVGPSRAGGQQAQGCGPEHRFGAGSHAQYLESRRDMGFDGVFRQKQLGRR